MDDIALIPPNTVSKVVFVTPDDAPGAFNEISSDQLEQKFGGVLSDLVSRFWPPQKTFGFSDGSDLEEQEAMDSGFKRLDSLRVVKSTSDFQKRSSPLKIEHSTSAFSIFGQQRSSANPKFAEKQTGKNDRFSQPVSMSQRHSKSPLRIEMIKQSDEDDRNRNSWSKGQTRDSFGYTFRGSVKKAAPDAPIDREDSDFIEETTKGVSSGRMIATGKVFKEDTVFKQVKPQSHSRQSNSKSRVITVKSTTPATRSTAERKHNKLVSDTPEYDEDDETDVKAKKKDQKLISEDSERDESWYRELLQKHTEKEAIPKTEEKKGWFCGFCTIRKPKPDPMQPNKKSK